MYASLSIFENQKNPGGVMGVHQKLDRIARWLVARNMPVASIDFPNIKNILYFEGSRGPDGLKTKSPGVDEPMHFIDPNNDNGALIGYIHNHHYNLVEALKKHDTIRASYEAAWMAHAITDGLTPAHHYPYQEALDELMGDHDYVKLFGKPIKGIMVGDNLAQTIRNNWLYIGAGGLMTKHIAFELGVANTIAPIPYKRLAPKNLKRSDILKADVDTAFYNSLERVASLKMYDRFLEDGWTSQTVFETREILIPEIARAIALAWAACIIEANKKEGKKHARKKSA